MLKPRHLVILAVVVAALAAISLLQKTNHERRTGSPASAVLLDGSWTREDVSRIALGYGDETEAVVLQRTPAGWTVPTAWQAKASDQKLDALLRALSGLTGEFRSDRAGVLGDYGLTPEGSVTIRIQDGEGREVIALDVGNQVSGGQGQFVRLAGNDAVYVSGSGVLSALGLYGGPARPESRHFLELQAVQEDKNSVDRIVLQDEHGTRTLTKVFALVPAAGDSTAGEPEIDRLTWEWELTGSPAQPLAKTRCDGVLGAVTSLRAVDVDDPGAPAADYGLAEPARRAVVVFADGRELVLAFGAERAAVEGRQAGVWLRVGDEPTVWVATTYATGNIFKTREDLQPGS